MMAFLEQFFWVIDEDTHEPRPGIIYEPCHGNGAITNVLLEQGYQVEARDLFTIEGQHDDFLSAETIHPKFDVIFTNPPYHLKSEFLAKCYELGKPFALLLPLQTLGYYYYYYYF
jgi:16S rRNA A1518/A1519 N6-dimethyltransferase RsmA/KsgA/DIM1 with predicted DNA glycosylase/AP lyase activity